MTFFRRDPLPAHRPSDLQRAFWLFIGCWILAAAAIVVVLGGCASTPEMSRAHARPFTQLGPWPYRVGPLTVMVFEREADVQSVCRTIEGARRATHGCYFTRAGREYVVTTPDWDVVLHEFKHVFEGNFHP